MMQLCVLFVSELVYHQLHRHRRHRSHRHQQRERVCNLCTDSMACVCVCVCGIGEASQPVRQSYRFARQKLPQQHDRHVRRNYRSD